VSNIEYHFVWVPQYRYKILTGDVALRVRELVRQTCEIFEIKLLQGVVSKDPVHILVSAPPNMAPSELMRWIKGRTASKRFEEFPLLKKRYWGRHFWGRGYFCATVGQMTEEMIQEYLTRLGRLSAKFGVPKKCCSLKSTGCGNDLEKHPHEFLS
jgi:putative transposase